MKQCILSTLHACMMCCDSNSVFSVESLSFCVAFALYTSELKNYVKLPGDLGISEKVNKQVVSTQCLDHHIFLEICIPKSLVYITPLELHLVLNCLIMS